MAPLLTALLVASAAGQQAKQEPAKAFPIVEVTTTGSERYDAEDILRSTGLKADANVRVPLDAVKAAAQKLIASGAFAKVGYMHTTAKGGMKVEFTLGDKDDDQFVRCDLGQMVWFAEPDLLADIHERVPLFNGTVPRDGSLADDVAAALEALLKEHGVSTTVSAERLEPVASEPLSEAEIYRAADIEIKIARIEAPGSSAAMKAEIDAESQRLVGIHYSRTSVRKFEDKNLRNIYLKHGYLRAEFAPAKVEVLANEPQSTSVALSIPVTEGRVYKLGSMKWTGNSSRGLGSRDLEGFIQMKPGQTVDGVELNREITKIRKKYATMGYMRMLLTERPTFDDAAGVVNYEFAINEGDLFEMGKLDVEGLQPESVTKIRQAWQLREGDPFDPAYINTFFKQFRLPPNSPYVVEESAGDRPKSVDVTIIFCRPNEPCRPRNEDHLYTPPVDDADAKDKQP